CFVVLKFAKRASYRYGCFRRMLNTTNYLRLHAQATGYVDDIAGNLLFDIQLHPVSHVEHFVHLTPIGSTLLVYDSKQWWYIEEVVFNYVNLVDEVQHFRLCPTTAVNDAVNLLPVFSKHLNH